MIISGPNGEQRPAPNSEASGADLADSGVKPQLADSDRSKGAWRQIAAFCC